MSGDRVFDQHHSTVTSWLRWGWFFQVLVERTSFNDDDENNFSLLSMESGEVQMPIKHHEGWPGYDQPPFVPHEPPAFNGKDVTNVKNSGPSQLLIAIAPVDKTAPLFDPATNTDTPPTIPSGKSIDHHDLESNKIVFCSLSMETRGEFCGIIQLSTELFHFKGNNVIWHNNSFNQYTNPPKGALWNEVASQTSHRLHGNSPQILSSWSFHVVWLHFCEFISQNVSNNKKCILVAHNGWTCNWKWIWKYTEPPCISITYNLLLGPTKRHWPLQSVSFSPIPEQIEAFRVIVCGNS